MLVVGDAVYHMNMSKVFKAFTGKFIALEAPGHPMGVRALTKTVAAALAMRGHAVREAAVALQSFNRYFVILRQFGHHGRILQVIREKIGAGAAVNAANADELPLLLFRHWS